MSAYNHFTKLNYMSGYAPQEGRGIDGAFQPLSTTIVQIIAEFADAYGVRI